MSVVICFAKRFLVVSAILLLNACSGGGGGGDQTRLSVSTSRLIFTADSTSSPTPSDQTFTIDVKGGKVYIDVSNSGNAIAYVDWYITDSNTALVTVHPASPSSLGLGVHTGTVQIIGCSDANCNSQVAGSPKVVNVSYQVGGLSGSTNAINLHAQLNAPSNTEQMTINGVSDIPWTSSVAYAGGATGWLTVTPSSGASLPATITFTGAPLSAPGFYYANVEFSSGSSTSTIIVSYEVGNSIDPVPYSLSYDINDSSSMSDYTQLIALNALPGTTWTATANVPWIEFGSSSGGGGDDVTVILDKNITDTFINDTYYGTVTITPSFGSPIGIGVTLNLRRARVSRVAPYVAIEDTENSVILRGELFSQATIQGVKFGDNSALGFTIVNSTEIRATHPKLPPGKYDVYVETLNGSSLTSASLVVVSATSYGATTIAYPDSASKEVVDIIYDAERQALLVGLAYPTKGSDGDVLRYAYSSNAWAATPSSVSVSSIRDIALSADGVQLLAMSDYAIKVHDPNTLSAGTTTDAPFSSFYYLKDISFANNGNAIVTTGLQGSGATDAYWYSAEDHSLSLVNWNAYFYFGSPGASSDGSNITIVQGGGLSPVPVVAKYEAATNTLSNAGISLNQYYQIPPVLDRSATRVLINGYLVYDSNYQLLGTLPTFSYGTRVATVLSPDGSRAYRYIGGTTLNTYDLASLPVSGVYSEIATGTTLLSDPGANPRMTISPDGGTLFIAGANGIVVMPVP